MREATADRASVPAQPGRHGRGEGGRQQECGAVQGETCLAGGVGWGVRFLHKAAPAPPTIRPASREGGGGFSTVDNFAYRIVQSMMLQWKRKRIGSDGIRKGVRVWALLKGE